MKLTNISKREANQILKVLTEDSSFIWNCKFVENEIHISNEYFSESEYYIIYNKEPNYVGIELNMTGDKLEGLIIDSEFAFADFKEWNIEAFKECIRKIFRHFKYYV